MREKIQRLFRNVTPAMLIVIAILLADNILNNNMTLGQWFYSKVIILPGIIIGLTFHEAAHGYASYFLGDPTPKLQGRLTLNPFKHMDPVGFIALMFAGFGWGVPVEIDPMYYKHRRADEFIVSIAGVATNFIIAVVFAFIVRMMSKNMSYDFYMGIGGTILEIFIYVVAINIILMIFNLLPVPPLDGFGILTQIFDLRKYNWYYTLYNNGFLILMILIIFNITDKIIDPLYGFFMNLLLW